MANEKIALYAGAVSAPEAQLAPVPLQAAATGNGNAHRAGFTYPTTWLGTLPQIAPLSGVSTGASTWQPVPEVWCSRLPVRPSRLALSGVALLVPGALSVVASMLFLLQLHFAHCKGCGKH